MRRWCSILLAILSLSFLLCSCSRAEALRPRRIALVEFEKTIHLYTNAIIDERVPRVYDQGSVRLWGPFYYIGRRGVYVIDAQSNRVVLMRDDREQQTITNYALYSNARIHAVDAKNAFYLSSHAYAARTVQVTNRIRYTVEVPIEDVEVSGERDTAAVADDEEETGAESAPQTRSDTRYRISIETRTEEALLPELIKITPQGVRVLFGRFDAETEGIVEFANVFVTRSGDCIVVARLNDAFGRKTKVYRLSEMGGARNAWTFEDLEANDEANGLYRQIDAVTVIADSEEIAILATTYADDRTEVRVMILNEGDGSLSERFRIPANSKELPIDGGLTETGELITASYNKDGEYAVSVYDINSGKRTRRVLSTKNAGRNLEFFSALDGIYSIRDTGTALEFLEWR